MAIIAKFNTCSWIFKHNNALQALHTFFESCLQGEYKKIDYKKGSRIDLDSGYFCNVANLQVKTI